MQLVNLRIENFRSIENLEISFDKVSTLIGGNNVGKSTILKALEYLFEPAPKIAEDDYFARGDEEISIIARFERLTPQEVEEFGDAVVDDSLTVKRTFSKAAENHLHYSALSMSYPDFAGIRAQTNKMTMRTMFNGLADQLDGLERATNADQVVENMAAWEQANPAQLELSFRRGFFGAPNVASGKLRKKTSLHLVPAVADAEEETSNAKSSPIVRLLSDISTQIYENRAEVRDFVERSNQEFDELVALENFPQLQGISERLTESLHRYYDQSSLRADWVAQDGVAVSFPKPTISVEDNGFQTNLANVGHGLQRASLFAVIQFLAESGAANEGEDFGEAQSDIILLIEEPEIYQHPHKQHVIYEAFHEICGDFSRATGIRFQIVFTTHSEKFIGINRFQTARILRRSGDGEASHSATALSIEECADYFGNLVNRPPMAAEAFEAKMHIFSREVCEGFFAEKIVLVEGITDKAILEGAYRAIGRDSLSEGISILQLQSKNSLDKPFYIFNKLGIPTFCVFDSDEDGGDGQATINCNRRLQTIGGEQQIEDYPDRCQPNYCAFDSNLEGYLRSEIGEGYDQMFQEISRELGLPVSELKKTPLAIAMLVLQARQQGIVFTKIDEILNAVDVLTPATP